jgi:flavorubredoxin
MQNNQLTDKIFYIGTDDKTIDLFEGQYVVPNGISYNSYVIMDEKIAVMDTVDKRATAEWFSNLKSTLADKQPDYLIVLHMEPDHAANIEQFLNEYPNAKLVSNPKTFNMIPQFFEDLNLEGRKLIVNENDTLSLGEHSLTFVMAPMVHWPEVMMAYENKEKILFSADAFGKFGTLDIDDEWDCEARRYYINIVGKYGAQVQTLLKKVATLDIRKIFPLHGPMLTENLEYYINKYDIWSSYRPEDEGIFIAYASIYGNTKKTAEKLKEILENKGAKNVTVADLARDDMAEAVEDAFRYDRLVLASVTYDGGLFPFMESFISHLKSKNYQNRKVAFIENGSWAPTSKSLMKGLFNTCKNIRYIEKELTILSALKENQLVDMDNVVITIEKSLEL